MSPVHAFEQLRRLIAALEETKCRKQFDRRLIFLMLPVDSGSEQLPEKQQSLFTSLNRTKP